MRLPSKLLVIQAYESHYFTFIVHCLGSMSQCRNIHQTGVLQGAEPSWYPTTSIPAAHMALGSLGPARAAVARQGATCSPSLLPGHPISPSSPCLGWNWLEFPQQCSWEMGKRGEVSWLQTRLYLIFCRLQLVPWSCNGRLLCRGAEAKPPGREVWFGKRHQLYVIYLGFIFFLFFFFL